MITGEDLQWIILKAEQSMVQDGNLDENLAASELRVAVIKFFYLLENPESRPVQEQYDLQMAIVGS